MKLAPDDMPSLSELLRTCPNRANDALCASPLPGWRLASARRQLPSQPLSTDRLRGLAWAAAALFLVALVVELVRSQTRPERDWYDGRAVAESGKSLAWLYAVAGDPFGPEVRGDEADGLLIQRLKEIRAIGPAARLKAIAEPSIPQALRELRASDPQDRREAYLSMRVIDQQIWYSDNANDERASASRWQRILVGTEVAGLVLALLWATSVLDVDAGAIAGAALAASSAWLAIKQHDNLAESYAITAPELGEHTHKARSAALGRELVGGGGRRRDCDQPGAHHVARPPSLNPHAHWSSHAFG
jgi:hypothetical protein